MFVFECLVTQKVYNVFAWVTNNCPHVLIFTEKLLSLSLVSSRKLVFSLHPD